MSKSQKNAAKVTDLGVVRRLSGLLDRIGLAKLAGQRFSGKRDFYTVFGWLSKVKSEDMLAKYVRQDIAGRIVSAPPNSTWGNGPLLTFDDLEEAEQNPIEEWETLAKENKIWSAITRADKLCRLGSFSLLFFGFDDTNNAENPVNTEGVNELLYVRPIGVKSVKNIKFDDDPFSARFGMPVVYHVEFNAVEDVTLVDGDISTQKKVDMKIHYTRVVHIVEDALENEFFGIPIIERCFNLLDDLMKVSGGSAENFWLTANRGMQADIDPEMELSDSDKEALADEIEEYQHQLRRVMRTRGVDIKEFSGTSTSPQQTFDMIMALLSGTTGIPRRILLGSEAGQLASEQDRANWAERIDERRFLFAHPCILEPVIEMLQGVGLLPDDQDVNVLWPNAFIMSPLEQSQMMAQQARAVGNLSRQTGNRSPMQITSVKEARKIMGLKGDLPEDEKMPTEADVEGQLTVEDEPGGNPEDNTNREDI